MDGIAINQIIRQILALDQRLEIGLDCERNIIVCYKDSDVLDGCVRIGTVGRGRTIEDAIKDYVRQISGKTLVFGYGESRKEIPVLFLGNGW